MLIAEIGNNHLGDMDKAKELIYAAVQSGADLVKGQAIDASTITHGSMPPAFYRQCELDTEKYLELIEYSRSLGVEMFYSIFGEKYSHLRKSQKYQKISGVQYKHGIFHDEENTFISIPKDVKMKPIRKAVPMYVMPYLPAAPMTWHYLPLYQNYYGSVVGFSDHFKNVSACIAAIKNYNVRTIEKHFILKKDKHNIRWTNKQLFRDCVHSATPDQFEKIARELK